MSNQFFGRQKSRLRLTKPATAGFPGEPRWAQRTLQTYATPGAREKLKNGRSVPGRRFGRPRARRQDRQEVVTGDASGRPWVEPLQQEIVAPDRLAVGAEV